MCSSGFRRRSGLVNSCGFTARRRLVWILVGLRVCLYVGSSIQTHACLITFNCIAVLLLHFICIVFTFSFTTDRKVLLIFSPDSQQEQCQKILYISWNVKYIAVIMMCRYNVDPLISVYFPKRGKKTQNKTGGGCSALLTYVQVTPLWKASPFITKMNFVSSFAEISDHSSVWVMARLWERSCATSAFTSLVDLKATVLCFWFCPPERVV